MIGRTARAPQEQHAEFVGYVLARCRTSGESLHPTSSLFVVSTQLGWSDRSIVEHNADLPTKEIEQYRDALAISHPFK